MHRRTEPPARRGPWALLLCAAALAGCASAPPPPVNSAHQAATELGQSAARALRQGDADRALTLYTQALARAEAVEDFELGGPLLLNLALVQARLGHGAQAAASLDRVLGAPQFYAAPLRAEAAARRGLLALDTPDLDAALRWADVAQTACAAPCPLAATLANLRAQVALARGDAEGAAAFAAQAQALATAAGQDSETANALRLGGRAHSRAGRTTQAAELLDQALAADRRLGLSDRVALDLMDLADNETRRARPAASRAFYERALNVYLAAGHRAAADGVRARIAALPAAAPD
jgi:tetratricopeptide (TPR) repeat protein